MAISLAISGRPPVEFDSDSIAIGTDPSGGVVLTDSRIKPRHAAIRKVAGRWMIEAREADSICVGNAEPARVHWLKAGDVIHLVENGPEITFQPAVQNSAPGQAPVAQAAEQPPLAWTPPPAVEPPSQYVPLFGPLPSPPGGAADAPPSWHSPAEDAPRKSLLDAIFEPPEDKSGIPVRGPFEKTPQRAGASAGRPGQRKVRKQSEAERDRHRDDALEVESQDSDPDHDDSEEDPLLRLPARADEPSFSSDSAMGWTIIWVAVGVGVLAVFLLIWFGSAPARGADRLSPVVPPGFDEDRFE